MAPNPDRPRDPRLPHATYEDPRGGFGFRTPAGVVGATAVGIGYAFAGGAGAAIGFGVALALALLWWLVRSGTRRSQPRT